MRGRNGQIGRIPTAISDLGMGKDLFLRKQEDSGVDYNALTSSSYARLTGRICVFYPIVVSSILWDIYASGTYICRLTTAGNGTTSLFDINTSYYSSGNEEAIIIPTNGDFLLLPGQYNLQLATADASTCKWWYLNFGWNDINGYYLSIDVYFTALNGAYSIPVKLRSQTAGIHNLTNFTRL